MTASNPSKACAYWGFGLTFVGIVLYLVPWLSNAFRWHLIPVWNTIRAYVDSMDFYWLGTGLCLIGLTLYAKARGRDPAWCALALVPIAGPVLGVIALTVPTQTDRGQYNWSLGFVLLGLAQQLALLFSIRFSPLAFICYWVGLGEVTVGLWLLGIGLSVIGLAFYAKAKEQSPTWSILACIPVFGSVVGLLMLTPASKHWIQGRVPEIVKIEERGYWPSVRPWILRVAVLLVAVGVLSFTVKWLIDTARESHMRAHQAFADREEQQWLAVLKQAEQTGPSHPRFAESVRNLNFLYRNPRKQSERAAFAQRLLTIREKMLQEAESLETVKGLASLAELYRELDMGAEAVPLELRLLAIREKILGPEHPDVVTSLTNLVSLYRTLHKYADAELYAQRLLNLVEKIHGPDHPLVAATLDDLASLNSSQRKVSQAEMFYRHALAIREKVLGPDNPAVLRTLADLAGVSRFQHNYSEAETFYRRILTVREKTLGSEHADVAASFNDLASLYTSQGKYPQAEGWYHRALAIQEKVLGQASPEVASTINILAALSVVQCKFAEAEILYRRELAIWEKAERPNDYSMAVNLEDYAWLLRHMKRSFEADKMQERANGLRKKLGQAGRMKAASVPCV